MVHASGAAMYTSASHEWSIIYMDDHYFRFETTVDINFKFNSEKYNSFLSESAKLVFMCLASHLWMSVNTQFANLITH